MSQPPQTQLKPSNGAHISQPTLAPTASPPPPPPELEDVFDVVIEANTRWTVPNVREMLKYRDLLYFLVWRDLKSQYVQSRLGFTWGLIGPIVQTILFTIIFDNMTKVGSDGVPYIVFSYTALLVWRYFGGAFGGARNSLFESAGIISKIYFPRLILPLVHVLVNLVSFGISLVVLLGLMLIVGVQPTPNVIFLPFIMLMLMLLCYGMGTLFAVLSVQSRDVSHGINVMMTVLLYGSPIIYSLSVVPDRLYPFYIFNPLVGFIESFRAALLGTGPMPWDALLAGSFTTIVVFVAGVLYFQRHERLFVDIT